MPDQIKIYAENRTEFGKGAARRIRRSDKVPAVIYGHGMDPLHITLPGHETALALRTANAVLNFDIEGVQQLALAWQVQRDPIKGFIEHVDLIQVRKGEKVVVDVAVILTGDAAPETLVLLESQTVSLEAVATNIPESVEVSIEGKEAGDQILAGDLVLPDGSELQIEDDTLIVNFAQPQSEAALEAELAEAEAEAGIEHEPSDDEKEAEAEGGEGEGDSEDKSEEE